VLMAACAEEPKSERWISVYSYPNDSTKFPLYLEITVKDGHVLGRALDGNMNEGIITGSTDGSSYSLLLHPLKQGSSSDQDIRYKGDRSKDSIVGEWIHVVGVKGPWTATSTKLGPKEALAPYKLPCEGSGTTELPSAPVASKTTPNPSFNTDCRDKAAPVG
jgi:hypothetical protein